MGYVEMARYPYPRHNLKTHIHVPLAAPARPGGSRQAQSLPKDPADLIAPTDPIYISARPGTRYPTPAYFENCFGFLTCATASSYEITPSI